MNREALAALMVGVDLLGLADLIDRPAWMADALCGSILRSSSILGEANRPARRRRFALAVPCSLSVWTIHEQPGRSLLWHLGRHSAEERRALRRALRRAAGGTEAA
jgi:hypothetical protein